MNLEPNSAPTNSPAPATEPHAGSEPLSEDVALAILKNHELLPEDVEQLSKNPTAMKSRRVRLAIASHPMAPRRIALRLIRELYTFDLAQFSLMPAAAADLRRLADEILVARLASLALGERIALARRSSARVIAALLLDRESRVWRTALLNSRLTEAAITNALQRPNASPALVEAISHHSRWCLRPEIRIALLRNAHTPLACAIEFARRIPPAQLRDILHSSRLPEKIRTYLLHDLQMRTK